MQARHECPTSVTSLPLSLPHNTLSPSPLLVSFSWVKAHTTCICYRSSLIFGWKIRKVGKANPENSENLSGKFGKFIWKIRKVETNSESFKGKP